MSDKLMPTKPGGWWGIWDAEDVEVEQVYTNRGRLYAASWQVGDSRWRWLAPIPDPTLCDMIHRFIEAHTAPDDERDDGIEFAAGGDPSDGRDVLIELLSAAIYAKRKDVIRG